MDGDAMLQFAGGLVLVITGAEFIVRGASRMAAMLGVQPLVIGLTVVALGTSSPELAIGITAALEGNGALAVGNIAGANPINLLLIVGLSALVRPRPLQLASIRLALPVMVTAAVVLVVMAWNGVLSRIEGVALLAAAIVYTAVEPTREHSPAAGNRGGLRRGRGFVTCGDRTGHLEPGAAHRRPRPSRSTAPICW